MSGNLDDFTKHFIKLIRDDKELHDATVRLINALAEKTEIANTERKRNQRQKQRQKQEQYITLKQGIKQGLKHIKETA
jgi:hypothetical protein